MNALKKTKEPLDQHHRGHLPDRAQPSLQENNHAAHTRVCCPSPAPFCL